MRTTRRTVAVLLATLLAATLVVAGCSSSTSEDSTEPTAAERPYRVLTEPTIQPGDLVPPPTGKVVLSLRNVPTTNVGRTLQFDLATLDRLGTVSYTVFDRQAEGRDVRFSGPLLRTVLKVAGVDLTKEQTLRCLALNDYAVDVPTGDAVKFPVLLATRADGKRMSVAHYGPTRFIYPTHGFNLDKTVYDPRWIWQLDQIVVR